MSTPNAATHEIHLAARVWFEGQLSLLIERAREMARTAESVGVSMPYIHQSAAGFQALAELFEGILLGEISFFGGTCPTCKGSGDDDLETCGLCYGTGKLISIKDYQTLQATADEALAQVGELEERLERIRSASRPG